MAAEASEAPTSPDPLTEVVEKALAQNPALKAAAYRAEASKFRPGQVAALPNPSLTAGTDVAAGMETRITAQQPFPAFGKRSLKEELARTDADMASLDYETQRLDLIAGVKSRFSQLQAARKTLELQQAESVILEQLETSIRTRYESGVASQTDLIKITAERTMLRQKLLKTEQIELSTLSALNQLMHQSIQSPIETAPLRISKDFIPDPRALWQAAQEYNPDIRKAVLQWAQSRTNRSLMRRETWPDWMAGVEYTAQKNSEDMVMLMVGVELPIWRQRNTRGIREAELLSRGAEEGLESVRSQVQSEIQEIGLCCARVQEALDLYKTELIPQAELRWKLSQEGYEAGTVAFADLIESRRFLLNVRQMEAEDEAELALELAKLERTLGMSVESFIKTSHLSNGSTPPNASRTASGGSP